MNITDKAALFKDLGLRVISEATVGYPIRAMDFNILCSLREYRYQLRSTLHKTSALTSFRIWLIAPTGIVSDSQDGSESKIPE